MDTSAAMGQHVGFLGQLVGLGFWFVIIILVIAGMWKTFEKAGKPGWAAIVPIYNVVVLLDIAGKEWWWIFLFLIPIVNIFINIAVSIGVAQAFGKGTGFGLGLAFLGPVFYCILGFGDAQYGGGAPAAAEPPSQNPSNPA